MRTELISRLLFFLASSFLVGSAPLDKASLEERSTELYVSPSSGLLEKWISTAKVTDESIEYAKSLLDLDAEIETFYKGDGKTEPTAPYSAYVSIAKAGGKTAASSGSAAALTADVVLQRNWAQMTTVAYCDVSTIAAWSCAACQNTTYPKPSSILTAVLNNTQFYAGYIPSTNQIFVAFRGAKGSSFANWVTNLDFGRTSYWISGKAPSGTSFHTGFQNQYSAMSGTVKSFVTTLAASYPTANIVFAGHSLGAAVAVHAALDLTVTKYVSRLTPANINVFTIGEPRIGNNDAGVWITGLGWSSVYRAVNYDDIVPHLPYQWLGFRHHRREWWILADGTSVVTCDDINAADNEDTNCLTSVAGTSISAHGVYFGVPIGSNC